MDVNEQAIMGMLNNNAVQRTPFQRFGTAMSGFANNPDLAMALLSNSGYGPKRSFGEVLGTSMMQANQMGQQRQDDAFKRQYMQAQMNAMGGKQQAQPNSVQEYEYAKRNGYKGSFQEWTVAGGQTSRPSSVQEWEFFNKLGPEEQRRYLEMKRNPNWKVGDVNEVPTVISGLPGGGVQTTALSTLPQVAASKETVKQSEAQGTRVGTAVGDIAGGIQTKGANAKTVIGMLDEADKLIDASTGSAVGAGLDKGAGLFGRATEGAKASAQLQVIQAGLMTNMPRMEGPQSDADVALYRQAAGQIGDPNVPNGIKKSALKTVRTLQEKYMDRAGLPTGNAPAVGTVKGGYRFKGGNPADKASWEPVQ